MTRRASARMWQWGAAALALGVLVYLLRDVLAPVFTAFLLAYVFDPVIDRLEARRIPRPLGILLLMVVGVLGLFGFGLLVAPTVAEDLTALLAELPLALQRIVDRIVPLLADLGIPVPTTTEGIFAELDARAADAGPAVLGSLRGALGVAATGTASLLQALGVALMVPVFFFYLLADFDHIVAEARGLLPAAVRPAVVDVVSEIDEVLGQFVRGQVSVMAILAVLYAGGYALVGVPLSVPIGLIAGAISFIPYVGGAVALGLALMMVGLHFEGVGQLLAVGAVYAVIQILEGFVITPRIVGDKLGLAPLWVLLALMAFGELFGFLGVMLALPAAAVIKVLLSRLLASYRRSGALGDGEAGLPRTRLRRLRPRRRRAGLRRLGARGLGASDRA